MIMIAKTLLRTVLIDECINKLFTPVINSLRFGKSVLKTPDISPGMKFSRIVGNNVHIENAEILKINKKFNRNIFIYEIKVRVHHTGVPGYMIIFDYSDSLLLNYHP